MILIATSFIVILDDDMENQDVLETFQSILTIVNRCETLSANFVKDGKIENASDYLMDVQVIKMSHDLMGSTSEKMGNNDFSEDEFIASLNNFVTNNNGEQDWDTLADMAVKCCSTSQFGVSFLGTFELDSAPRPGKVVKERQRASKKQVGPAKAPTNIKQLKRDNKGAEKINIVRSEIQRVCRERGTDCIPYFELICDPRGFMKSIDKAFQISFLVRDGFLGMKKINKEPHVYLYDPDPMSEHTQESQRNKSSDTVQCVMSMNPQMWEGKIRQFKIQQPLLEFDESEEETEEQEQVRETDSEEEQQGSSTTRQKRNGKTTKPEIPPKRRGKNLHESESEDDDDEQYSRAVESDSD